MLSEAGRRHRQGDLEGAAAAYRAALADPLPAAQAYLARLGLTRALADLGRPAEALEPCAEAARTDPHNPLAFGMLALVLLALDRPDDAAVAAAMAVQLKPTDIGYLNLAASIALSHGLPDQARDLSQRALLQDPHDPRALSDLIAACNALGDDSEARRLADLDTMVRSTVVAAPAGFASVATFNEGLAQAITGREDLHRPHSDRTMAGGTRLLDALDLDSPYPQALTEIFATGVADYVQALPGDRCHPLVVGRPPRLRYQAWANVVEQGDFERPHIHEAGWLSGVYYVQTAPGAGGAIVLGGHHDDGGSGERRAIEPLAGQLLMFPSYLHHRTTPFVGPGRRISVAFDVRR